MSLHYRLGDNRYFVQKDVISVLQGWLGTNPEGNQLIVAAVFVAAFSTSDHIEWWLGLEPEEEPAHTVWVSTLYSLKRKQWQE